MQYVSYPILSTSLVTCIDFNPGFLEFIYQIMGWLHSIKPAQDFMNKLEKEIVVAPSEHLISKVEVVSIFCNVIDKTTCMD